MGVERFVMDDGWFGKRKDGHAGLGDWYVNPAKFPNGLKPLIDKVHTLGMDFGLWVEPEMVNPDSDLYRKHPDWVLNFTGRPRTEERNQLVLNLARKDVRDYLYGFLDEVVVITRFVDANSPENNRRMIPVAPNHPPNIVDRDLLPRLRTNVLILEGLSTVGTEAAVDLAMDDDRLLPILEPVRRPNGSLPHFEMLLESDALGESAGPARVIALHLHD